MAAAIPTPDRPGIVGRMAANAVAQIVGIPLQSLLSLATFAAITRYLGPSVFGDYVAAMAYLFLPTVIADLGISTIVLRDISTEPERMDAIVRAATAFRVAVSTVAIGASVGVAYALPFNNRAQVAILIGAGGSFLTLLNLSLLPVLQAQLRMHWAVVASIAGRLTTLVVTLAALAAGLGFKTIVLATVIGNAVVLLFDLRVVWALFPVRPTVDPVYWRRLLRTSLVLGSGIAILNIYFRIDAVLLALLRPAAEVGLYGAAYKFVELAGALSGGIVVSLVPSLTSLAARGDSRFNSLAQRGFDVLIFIAIPISVSMVLAAKTLLHLTAGAKFESASDALKILALYPLLSFANAVFLRMLIAAHLERMLLPIALGILALNVGLNLVFIPMYGYRAAAVASVASEVASLLAMGWMVRVKLGFNLHVAYLTRLLGAGGCMALVAWLLPIPELGALVVGGLVYVVILLVLPGTVRWTASELALTTGLRR